MPSSGDVASVKAEIEVLALLDEIAEKDAKIEGLLAEVQAYRDVWMPLSKRWSHEKGEPKPHLEGFTEYLREGDEWADRLQRRNAELEAAASNT